MAQRPHISTPQGSAQNIGLWLNTPNGEGQTTGKHVLWGKINGVKTRAYLNRNKQTQEAFLTFSNMEAEKDANGWFQKLATGRLVKADDGSLQMNMSMIPSKETVLAATVLTEDEAAILGFDPAAASKSARPAPAAAAPVSTAARPMAFDDMARDDDIPF